MYSAAHLVLRQGRLSTTPGLGPYQSVLVPLDGSAFAELALGPACAVARAVRARLVLVRVRHGHGDEVAYLDRVAARLTGLRATGASVEVLDGDVAAAICARADRLDGPLVVMSSHGRTGLARSWLGSVADGVVRHATTPVLIVPPPRCATVPLVERDDFDPVIVALDGSAFSAQIAPHAVGLAEAMHARVLLLRVVATPAELDDADADLGAVAERVHFVHPNVRVAHDVRVSRTPAASIARCAAALPRVLVALATHGRGLSRYVVGSVTDAVIRTRLPVLLVRAAR